MLREKVKRERRKRVRSVDGGNLVSEVRKRMFVTILNALSEAIAMWRVPAIIFLRSYNKYGVLLFVGFETTLIIIADQHKKMRKKLIKKK